MGSRYLRKDQVSSDRLNVNPHTARGEHRDRAFIIITLVLQRLDLKAMLFVKKERRTESISLKYKSFHDSSLTLIGIVLVSSWSCRQEVVLSHAVSSVLFGPNSEH